jgi:hypothetical protein
MYLCLRKLNPQGCLHCGLDSIYQPGHLFDFLAHHLDHADEKEDWAEDGWTEWFPPDSWSHCGGDIQTHGQKYLLKKIRSAKELILKNNLVDSSCYGNENIEIRLAQLEDLEAFVKNALKMNSDIDIWY